MKIIIYKKEYENEMVNLHRHALDEIDARPKDPSWEDDLYNVKEAYFKNGGIFLLMIDNGHVIGMGALKVIDDKTGEIKRMRVKKEYRNKKIATSILIALEDRAKELGLMKLILSTTKIQNAAISLYKRNGYSEYMNTKEYGFDVIYFYKLIV